MKLIWLQLLNFLLLTVSNVFWINIGQGPHINSLPSLIILFIKVFGYQRLAYTFLKNHCLDTYTLDLVSHSTVENDLRKV